MADLNIFILIGRLTRDPEISYTSANDPICKFSLANNPSFKKDDPATFFNITAWKKTADIISQYCKKGDQVRVTCRVTANNFTDREGVKHFGYNFSCQEIQFLSSPSRAGGEDRGPARPASNPYTNDPKARNEEIPRPSSTPKKAYQMDKKEDPASFNVNDFEPLADDDIPL